MYGSYQRSEVHSLYFGNYLVCLLLAFSVTIRPVNFVSAKMDCLFIVFFMFTLQVTQCGLLLSWMNHLLAAVRV